MAVHTRAATQQRASSCNTTSNSSGKGHNNGTTRNNSKEKNINKPPLRSARIRQGYLAAKSVGRQIRGVRQNQLSSKRGKSCWTIQRSELNSNGVSVASRREVSPRKAVPANSVQNLTNCIVPPKRTTNVKSVKVCKSSGEVVNRGYSDGEQDDQLTQFDATDVNGSQLLCSSTSVSSSNSNNLRPVKAAQCEQGSSNVRSVSHGKVDLGLKRKLVNQTNSNESLSKRRVYNVANIPSSSQVETVNASPVKRSSRRSPSSISTSTDTLFVKNQKGEIVRCKKSGKMFQVCIFRCSYSSEIDMCRLHVIVQTCVVASLL